MAPRCPADAGATLKGEVMHSNLAALSLVVLCGTNTAGPACAQDGSQTAQLQSGRSTHDASPDERRAWFSRVVEDILSGSKHRATRGGSDAAEPADR